MKNSKKSIFFHATSLFSALTLAMGPLCAQEECYYQNYDCGFCTDEYCPEDWCCDWYGVLLPAVAGAGTAAGVAYGLKRKGRGGRRGDQGSSGNDGQNGVDGRDGSTGKTGCSGHRGKRGNCGHRGSQGEKGESVDFCQRDVGETLTFNFLLELNDNLNSDCGEIIPYVEQPDGTVIEAEHLDTETIYKQSAMLTINNPCYGTYHFGYFIPDHRDSVDFYSTIIVETSRDNTNTIYNDEGVFNASLKQSQSSDAFTYFINDGVSLPE